MGQRLGLAADIDRKLHLLKPHLPYHESDHVLNLAYNALLGGVRLEDIDLRRNDEAFLDGLDVQRLPDMRAINLVRERSLYRILGYNHWLEDFFATWERLRRLAVT
jgi:hypothetical protein